MTLVSLIVYKEGRRSRRHKFLDYMFHLILVVVFCMLRLDVVELVFIECNM